MVSAGRWLDKIKSENRIFMLQAFCFWWVCIREAAKGTLDKANAWFWPIGVPIVAFAGWYWEMGELTIPDTAPGFFIFMVVTVAISWVVFFVIRLFGAPARVYALLENEKSNLHAELEQLRANRATLTISGPHKFKEPMYKNKLRWRMEVHNAGPAIARDVRIRLKKGTATEPLDSNWTGDYPYPVYPVGTIKNDPRHIAAIGRLIHVDDDEKYEIVCGWKSEIFGFFTDINTKGGGHNEIQISSDERWMFPYEVTAENAAPIKFVLEIFINNDEVAVTMV
jgi:hypothetical protein